MLNHALFYPDWDISDPVFLAESLLYWDQLACIVPFLNFSVQPSHPDEEMRKALAEAHEKYVFPLGSSTRLPALAQAERWKPLQRMRDEQLS